VLVADYGLDMGALAGLFRGGPVTAEATRAAMADFYRTLPFDFAPQFAAMFRELIAGRAPLAVNCSAGKDRTGVAAALILSVLGVPRETVIADYLLSNRYFRAEMPKGVGEDPTARLLASLPPDAIQALMGVERVYIEASFAAIEAKGGLDRYVRETLGLSARDLQTLRRRYLVR
jgi:protein-tyrosine phosphatase